MKIVSIIALLAACGTLALSGCNGTKAPAPGPTDSTSAAAVTTPKPAPGDADANASAMLAAAEPFETLTEQAQTASAAKLPSLISDAQKAARGIAPALEAPQQAALATNLFNIHAAHKANDRTGIALAAVAGYRTLVESAKDTGKVPLAVSLLDYSGFRFQADLSAKPTRWEDMATAVSFAAQQWSGIEARVTDTALKADFVKSIDGMNKAVEARDAKAAKSSSTHELDLVDKLEGFFSK